MVHPSHASHAVAGAVAFAAATGWALALAAYVTMRRSPHWLGDVRTHVAAAVLVSFATACQACALGATAPGLGVPVSMVLFAGRGPLAAYSDPAAVPVFAFVAAATVGGIAASVAVGNMRSAAVEAEAESKR